jgi:hypothetical protein
MMTEYNNSAVYIFETLHPDYLDMIPANNSYLNEPQDKRDASTQVSSCQKELSKHVL